MYSNVFALILAAGSSSRMGRAKQLLEFRGSYLLEYVIRRTLPLNFSEIIAVIGHQSDQVQSLIHIEDKRFRWFVNRNYHTGQSSSLVEGIKKGRHHSSVMVFLGDQPLISEETIRLVFQRGLEQSCNLPNQPFVIRPSFQGVPGHPVFIGNFRMIDFTSLEGDQGAKQIIRNINHSFLLPVEDPGILFDIDTPEAYEKSKHANDSNILKHQGFNSF
ncbi:nucleotidyltransferase family protein [Collibacillus ludicampi]|uniref:nucleotidyltransferase family protein n=1 Tax=Collibacillus ludicampi TaxID=2771369 RepID=UPI002493F6A8|nr:nucleotidyltransferase family protein [Collibacillus ludicampi]